MIENVLSIQKIEGDRQLNQEELRMIQGGIQTHLLGRKLLLDMMLLQDINRINLIVTKIRRSRKSLK